MYDKKMGDVSRCISEKRGTCLEAYLKMGNMSRGISENGCLV